jgi:hypothetical protein
MFIVEDTDDLLKLRYDTKISRIGENIKTQRIFFSENYSERLETFAERLMIEPTWFDFYDDGEEDDEDLEDEENDENEEE